MIDLARMHTTLRHVRSDAPLSTETLSRLRASGMSGSDASIRLQVHAWIDHAKKQDARSFIEEMTPRSDRLEISSTETASMRAGMMTPAQAVDTAIMLYQMCKWQGWLD